MVTISYTFHSMHKIGNILHLQICIVPGIQPGGIG